MTCANREEWLLKAVELLKPLFNRHGYIVPPTCRVSCGFPSTGVRSHHIGQCWPRSRSADGHNQISISPALASSAEVLDTLVHELVHAVDDCQHKHGKEFKKIAHRIGLEGPMRSASAGPALRSELQALAQRLGPYPHGQLKVIHRYIIRTPRPRAKCPQCSFTMPMLQRFLAYGPPLCPQHKVEMLAKGDWGED